MSDLQCPYCSADHEVCHDDGFGYEEGVRHHDECGSCGKRFVFETSISFYFDPQKADCLNDGNHDFRQTCTVPIDYTMMACVACDERRPPTDAEMEAIRAGRPVEPVTEKTDE